MVKRSVPFDVFKTDTHYTLSPFGLFSLVPPPAYLSVFFFLIIIVLCVCRSYNPHFFISSNSSSFLPLILHLIFFFWSYYHDINPTLSWSSSTSVTIPLIHSFIFNGQHHCPFSFFLCSLLNSPFWFICPHSPHLVTLLSFTISLSFTLILLYMNSLF